MVYHISRNISPMLLFGLTKPSLHVVHSGIGILDLCHYGATSKVRLIIVVPWLQSPHFKCSESHVTMANILDSTALHFPWFLLWSPLSTISTWSGFLKAGDGSEPCLHPSLSYLLLEFLWILQVSAYIPVILGKPSLPPRLSYSVNHSKAYSIIKII